MGYFGARVGQAPGGHTPKPAGDDSPMPTPRSLFAAKLGQAPAVVSVSPVAGPVTAQDAPRCPRCGGALEDTEGVSVCQGRCGRCWLEVKAGRWLDLATLPYGACRCCEPRQALVAAECGAICPISHTEYLVLPEGIVLRSEAAPDGICRCCLPPQPLVRVDGALVCRAKPYQHYAMRDGAVAWLGKAETPGLVETVAAIDAALSRNSAKLTVNGLFNVNG